MIQVTISETRSSPGPLTRERFESRLQVSQHPVSLVLVQPAQDGPC
jgi:hypothetical protein